MQQKYNASFKNTVWQKKSNLPRFFVAFAATWLAFCSPAQKVQKTTIPPGGFTNILIAKAEKGDPYGPCEPSICVNPTNTQNIAAGAILL